MPPENTLGPVLSILMLLPITPPPEELSANRDQRSLQRESLSVKGLAHDGTLHAVGHQRSQRDQVVKRGDAAAGHHRLVGALADAAKQVQVGSAQGAVLGD